jgi:hypothetical protein
LLFQEKAFLRSRGNAFFFIGHRLLTGLRGDIMARPQETFKKREKDMKRREKRERKIQRRLEKKALATKDGHPNAPDALPDDPPNESEVLT